MSELPAGFTLPEAATPATPRPSASILLSRDTPDGVEILLGLRNPRMRAFPDFWSLPGGGVSRHDRGLLDLLAPDVRPSDEAEAASLIAMLRELAEELGWEARGSSVVSIQPTLQEALQAGAEVFAAAWRDGQLDPEPSALRVVDDRTTPPFGPMRFHNRFFHLHLDGDIPPPETAASGEFTEARWFTLDEVRDGWRNHTLPVPAPVARLLQDFTAAVAQTGGGREAGAHIAALPTTEGSRIEFSHGVEVRPLRTATLPPATHTNCYLLGPPGGQRLVVDPCVQTDEAFDMLRQRVAAVHEDGGTVVGAFYTHGHSDHSGGWQRAQAEFGWPVWCSAVTGMRIGCDPDRVIGDGDVIELRGPEDEVQRWTALATPGHDPGHVCLNSTAGMIVGDMVAGIGTILVPPGEGDMDVYIEQLERMLGLRPRLLFPSHGPIVARPQATLERYLAHRRARHARVLEAVEAGVTAVGDISVQAYEDTPDAHPVLAADQTLAHLLALERQGRVERRGGNWVPA